MLKEIVRNLSERRMELERRHREAAQLQGPRCLSKIEPGRGSLTVDDEDDRKTFQDDALADVAHTGETRTRFAYVLGTQQR